MEYLKGMSQAMKQAQADNTSESYGYVATELVKSKNDIRQAIEQATAGAVAAIIGKLENNQPLTDAEKQTVKLWVVGDAEGYVKMENNFQDWLQEYRRLMDVIAAWEARPARSRNWWKSTACWKTPSRWPMPWPTISKTGSGWPGAKTP